MRAADSARSNDLGGHSGTLAQESDPSPECKTGRVSLSVWLRAGWFVLAADFAYWLWELRQPEEQQLSSWHATLNIVLYYGGGLLFVVLLIVSYIVWRLNQRER